MGWNDHLADPDDREAYVAAAWDKADMDRKRQREDALFACVPDESAGLSVTASREGGTPTNAPFIGRSYDGETFYLGDDECDCESCK